MEKVKLALFALDHLSAMALDLAGAAWIGGDHRRARAQAHARLYDQAMDKLIGADWRQKPR